MTDTDRTWPDPRIADDLRQLRRRVPLTHCLTNIVVTNFTANALLAVGASPAMVIAVQEVGEFAPVADALLINVGTLTAPDAEAQLAAAGAARAAGTPWVLDPVAVGGLSFRTRIATELLEHRPAIIRGNGSEILGLAGAAAGGRGVESTAGSVEALPAAQDLAKRTGAVVAVSGATDYITDGDEVVTVPGGHVWLTKVTGAGCALGALMAAFLPVTDDPLRAAADASAVVAAAAEHAAAETRAPGSFAVAFLDHLTLLGAEEVTPGRPAG